ncbi:hypothetical protein N8I77_004517 [Diaporthe amygdali]|uniref:DNA mismatch repair protein S5 domain-containing protein n=1 Tax=Phomopsis amygdali TaxID=1214568 RepID=A0AAD9SNK8_PHOAM|nr:hypothetical protein N8I77_004517 [Diaporthe amygdali]
MPIAALPETTVRLLGSAGSIATPVDVVKELLDNAIDAGATSVEILVSANLVDNIQVRDNGHGIQPDDYNSLGRMGHTSKLRSFEELHNFGGNTLGFRGQALASTNSLGRVTVITRSIEDPTAVKLTIQPGCGGIESQQCVSAPIGTTVFVTGLFSFIPVREQVAIREAQKNLAKTKQLLNAYALARPLIRVSFKILGGNLKQSWSYSPSPKATVREAVVQVFGTGLMSQCVFKVVATESDYRGDGNAHDGSQLTIEAVLPKPDADLSKLSKGSFFSVDSRPVSTSRGTMKKLLSTFKTHLRKSLGVDVEDRRLSDTFICVNVKCSPGTYDPNVEPSKSRVFFSDESQLMRLFEVLCSQIYPTQKTVDAFVTIEKRPLRGQSQTRTPPPSSDGPQEFTELPEPYRDEPSYSTSVRRPRTPDVSSPYTVLRGSLEAVMAPSEQMKENRHPPKTQLTGHPHAPQWPGELSDLGTVDGGPHRGLMRLGDPPVSAIREPGASIEQSPTPGNDGPALRLRFPSRSRSPHGADDAVPHQASSGRHQGPRRGFVVNMSTDPDLTSDEEAEAGTSSSCDLREAYLLPEEPIDNSKEALNPWTIAKMTAPARQRTADDIDADSAGRRFVHTQERCALPMSDDVIEEDLPILRPQRGAPRDLDTPRVMRFANSHIDHLQTSNVQDPDPRKMLQNSQTISQVGHDLSQTHSHTGQSTERRKLPDIEFHRDDPEDCLDPDGLVQTTLSFDKLKKPRSRQKAQAQLHINEVPTRRNPPYRKPKRVKERDRGDRKRDACTGSNLEEHLLESRNEDKPLNGPARHRRAFDSPISQDFVPMDSGDNNTINLTVAQQLDHGNTGDSSFDGDSRKYLMRRQRSEAEHRRKGRQSIKRTKTCMLPLETVPSSDGTVHLMLNLEPDSTEFCIASKRTLSLVEYRQKASFGALMSLEDVDEIQSRLQTVISGWTQKTFGKKADIELNLQSAVKNFAAA